jgi:hypothetical protein
MATFADDTAVMAVEETVENSARNKQSAVNIVVIWAKNERRKKNWVIKLNESKSVYIEFTNKIKQQPIFINFTKVPYANTAKYLGMTLDANLQWKEHIEKIRDELNIKYRKMYWLLRRSSELSVHNKITLY